MSKPTPKPPVTKREISDRYFKIVIAYTNPLKRDQPKETPCYYCSDCLHGIKTICIDEGTTPYFFICDKCGKGISKTELTIVGDPVFEWFRPALNRVLAMRRKDPKLMQYILQGGLHYRRIAAKKP